MSVPITKIDISGLAAYQGAYLLDTGVKVIAAVEQQDAEANPTNLTPEAHKAVRVRVWVINDDGTPFLENGRRVEAPLRWESILESALADGTINLQDKLADYVSRRLIEARNWLIARQQFAAIPTAQ